MMWDPVSCHLSICDPWSSDSAFSEVCIICCQTQTRLYSWRRSTASWLVFDKLRVRMCNNYKSPRASFLFKMKIFSFRPIRQHLHQHDISYNCNWCFSRSGISSSLPEAAGGNSAGSCSSVLLFWANFRGFWWQNWSWCCLWLNWSLLWVKLQHDSVFLFVSPPRIHQTCRRRSPVETRPGSPSSPAALCLGSTSSSR